MTMLLAAIAVSATAYTLIMPMFAGEGAGQAHEGGRQRARADPAARARPHLQDRKVSLRQSPEAARLKGGRRLQPRQNGWPGSRARQSSTMAGYRGQAPYITFLFFRLVTPILMFYGDLLYRFRDLAHGEVPGQDRHVHRRGLSRHAGADAVPQERDLRSASLSIKRAFPDALDLLLICIESGMSIEAAFRKVSEDRHAVGRAVRGIHADHGRTVLSAGPQGGLRKPGQAHRPRGREIGLPGLAAVGTLRHAARPELRVMAQENRDMRMNEAEKKAAGAAAEADGADDPVLPAGAVRRHPRVPDRHQGPSTSSA
jgi:tight adherence protein C